MAFNANKWIPPDIYDEDGNKDSGTKTQLYELAIYKLLENANDELFVSNEYTLIKHPNTNKLNLCTSKNSADCKNGSKKECKLYSR